MVNHEKKQTNKKYSGEETLIIGNNNVYQPGQLNKELKSLREQNKINFIDSELQNTNIDVRKLNIKQFVDEIQSNSDVLSHHQSIENAKNNNKKKPRRRMQIDLNLSQRIDSQQTDNSDTQRSASPSIQSANLKKFIKLNSYENQQTSLQYQYHNPSVFSYTNKQVQKSQNDHFIL